MRKKLDIIWEKVHCGNPWKMGGQVFEREQRRISGNADAVNAFGGRYPGTVEADE